MRHTPRHRRARRRLLSRLLGPGQERNSDMSEELHEADPYALAAEADDATKDVEPDGDEAKVLELIPDGLENEYGTMDDHFAEDAD